MLLKKAAIGVYYVSRKRVRKALENQKNWEIVLQKYGSAQA